MAATTRHTRSARIVRPDDSVARCKVRALSRLGAAIELPPGEALTPHFILALGRQAYEARRVWRRGDVVGVMLRRAVA